MRYKERRAVVDARRRGVRRAVLKPLTQLARLQRERELTDAALARKVGCSIRLLQLLRSGYRPRTVDLVEAIARALDVDVAILTAPVLKIIAADRGAFFVNVRRNKTP